MSITTLDRPRPTHPTPTGPGRAERLQQLAAAIRRHAGEWTTDRVLRTYRHWGYRVPNRATARRDLDLLVRSGRAARHEQPGRVFFTRTR